ncbi:phosphonate ABC transporter substrate-binding protein [Phreatobacter stygius]|uniref:Phosphonate ABC transporter substrate-binding protein n=1 Tax=Phreatobacter stygius TaxID=1940610 RepID=A0A4D7B6Z3_9HYPH|nr:phosphonate ABC transporter substrate-binding protein [Phreatobacter stygius]QCI63922.1 phosphonate ABC transporter substrate-binding protein [Phreatobacter stygius]
MFNRRKVLAGLAGLALAATAVQAQTQGWQSRYPELVFAVIPAENASGVTERYGPFVEYLSRELGTKVTLRIANDYAAVIEGQRAGQIHLAYYGPASYVRARTVTNGVVDPFVTSINSDGSIGYYSVLYVRADNPATKIEDLRGKNLCLVDPNSTSGNNVPRFALSKLGIANPDQFFARVVYAGSHENAVTAVQQGTCDAAFNWWNSETDSNLSRMANKNMVRAEDFKMIFKSDLIAGSPYAFITTLPEEARAAIVKAFMEAPARAKAAFDRLSDGKDLGFHAVTHRDYEPIVELQKFVDQMRRART